MISNHSLQNIQPDVLQIILNYMSPTDLLKIFVFNHLDFRMKFTYDASYYDLTIDIFILIFELFPHIVLKGISITCYDKCVLSPLLSSKAKLFVLKIRFKAVTSFSVNVLQNYPNITKLIIDGFPTLSLDKPLLINNNITFIELNNISYTSNFSFLLNFFNLHTIKITGKIFDNLMIILPKCKALKTLIFDNINCTSNQTPPNFSTHPKLQCIKLPTNYGSYLTSINEFRFISSLLETITIQKYTLTIECSHGFSIHYINFKIPISLKIKCEKDTQPHNLPHLLTLLPIYHLSIIYPTPYTETIHLPNLPTIKTIKLVGCSVSTHMLNSSVKIKRITL